MVNKQRKAMRLADELEKLTPFSLRRDLEPTLQAAAELRRLQTENEDFRATCDHLTRENAGQIGEIVALKEQRDELLEALATCRANFRRYEEQTLKMAQAEDEERASLRTQRNELLEALKEATDLLQVWIECCPPYDEALNDRKVLKKARAAIAKAGGAA